MTRVRFSSSLRCRFVAFGAAALVAAAVGACASEGDDASLGGSDDPEDCCAPSSEPPTGPVQVEDNVDLVIEATRGVASAELDYELTVDSPVTTATASLRGDLDRSDVGILAATTEAGGQQIGLEVRSDGDAAWVTSDAPAFTDALPSGATWVEATIDELRGVDAWTGLDTTFDVVAVLRGAEDVRDAGATTVGGDEVHEFEARIDWQAALDAADGDERAGLEESVSVSPGSEIEEAELTFGLDGDYRVRTFDFEVVVGPEGGNGDDTGFGSPTVTLRLGFEAASYDHDVEAPEAPPADETVPLDEVPEVADLLAEGI